MRQGRDMATSNKARLDKLYTMLQEHGYTGGRATFDAQKAALDRAMDESTLKGQHIFSMDGGRFYIPSPDAFGGCLFAEPVRQLHRAIVATFFGWRIVDRRFMRSSLFTLESIFHAVDVHIHCGKTKEYQDLLNDRYHRQKDYLPNDANLAIVKATQCLVIMSMFRYFSIVAEYEAVRMATGMREIPVIAQQRTLIRRTSRTPFEDVYDQYERSPRAIEDDYVFMDAAVAHLKKIVIDPPFRLQCFDISKFRPTKGTLALIMENQVITGRGFFDAGDGDPYNLPEWHLNPYYLAQVRDLFSKARGYAMDSLEEKDRQRMIDQWDELMEIA